VWVKFREFGRRGEVGQAAMEFLLIVPLVFTFLFFAVEGANIVKTWMIVESASREGARCGAVRHSSTYVANCAANVTCQSPSATPGTLGTNCLLAASDVTVCVNGSCPADPSSSTNATGVPVQVKISKAYDFQLFKGGAIPFITGTVPSMTMTAQTQMRLEEQTN
jgi:Flp pilus assembly protein TadG